MIQLTAAASELQKDERFFRQFKSQDEANEPASSSRYEKSEPSFLERDQLQLFNCYGV